jgi:DNA-binding GntR family transcriptional regulator
MATGSSERRKPAKKGEPARTRSARRALDPYAILRDEIIANTRLPNERLVESDLTGRFATNRNVVRSALLRLEADGLIVREPNRGARVRIITAAEACEIVEVRAAIEVVVARRAAENSQPTDIPVLRSILGEMREALTNNELLRYTQLNASLHAAILKISKHATAEKVLASLKLQTLRSQYRAVFVPGRAAMSLAEHEETIDAIIRQDPERAAKSMETHMFNALSTINELAKLGLHE